MSSYPRETVEFVPVVVTVDGTAVTAGVEVSITESLATRPTEWNAADTLDGKTGFMIDHETPGNRYVWARITDNPEVPVVYCGAITIT